MSTATTATSGAIQRGVTDGDQHRIGPLAQQHAVTLPGVRPVRIIPGSDRCSIHGAIVLPELPMLPPTDGPLLVVISAVARDRVTPMKRTSFSDQNHSASNPLGRLQGRVVPAHCRLSSSRTEED